jgi:hypothetical protein
MPQESGSGRNGLRPTEKDSSVLSPAVRAQAPLAAHQMPGMSRRVRRI